MAFLASSLSQHGIFSQFTLGGSQPALSRGVHVMQSLMPKSHLNKHCAQSCECRSGPNTHTHVLQYRGTADLNIHSAVKTHTTSDNCDIGRVCI